MTRFYRLFGALSLALFMCLAGTAGVASAKATPQVQRTCPPGSVLCTHGGKHHHHPTGGCTTSQTGGTTRASATARCSVPPKTHGNSGSNLPFTGSNIIIPGTIAGLVLLAVGGFVLMVTRRRRKVLPAT
jgi:LPXTG-motif cell wall-anchored protein